MAEEISEIVVKLNFLGLIDEMENRAAQLTAIFVRNFARTLVRKKSMALMNTIRTNKIGQGEYETIAGGSGTPYALAQEYGRPDLATYGFTPYMRPAATASEESQEVRDQIKTETAKALKNNVINKRIKT